MSAHRLRVNVVGDPRLCPTGVGIASRPVGREALPGPPLADVVIIDLEAAGETALAVIARAADLERGVVVLAVSRDPEWAAAALAAGATEFILLPRDADWLRAAVLRERDRRRAGVFDRADAPLVVDVPAAGLAFEEYEKRVVQHALARTGWNRSRAARELEISRPRLVRMIERHGLVESPGAGAGRS